MVLQCNPGWPQACHLPASSSRGQGLLLLTITYGFFSNMSGLILLSFLPYTSMARTELDSSLYFLLFWWYWGLNLLGRCSPIWSHSTSSFFVLCIFGLVSWTICQGLSSWDYRNDHQCPAYYSFLVSYINFLVFPILIQWFHFKISLFLWI
jgi:hypothetical protein